jgi:hypothetical protein
MYVKVCPVKVFLLSRGKPSLETGVGSHTNNKNKLFTHLYHNLDSHKFITDNKRGKMLFKNKICSSF